MSSLAKKDGKDNEQDKSIKKTIKRKKFKSRKTLWSKIFIIINTKTKNQKVQFRIFTSIFIKIS